MMSLEREKMRHQGSALTPAPAASSRRRFIGSIWVLCILCAFWPALALAHHRVGHPRYLRDARYSKPILVVTETVGPWRVEVTHVPGNPAPDEACEVELTVRDLQGAAVQFSVEGSLERLSLFETSKPHCWERQGNGAIRAGFTYPEQGNYLMSLKIEDVDTVVDLSVFTVVGRPGAAWIGLCVFVGFLAILVLVVVSKRRSESRVTETER